MWFEGGKGQSTAMGGAKEAEKPYKRRNPITSTEQHQGRAKNTSAFLQNR